MPFEIVRNDITKMEVDAIVNAANNQLAKGGGVCGQIFAAAGAEKLEEACDRIGYCQTGGAVLTDAFALPARYVIHTVGPIWRGGTNDEATLLAQCYYQSLKLATDHDCASIAFPLISSGIYGYPLDQALHIAVSEISKFVLEHDIHVYLVVYDKASYQLSAKIFTPIQQFIDDHYVELSMPQHRQLELLNEPQSSYIAQVIEQRGETFSEMLMRLIAESGQSEVDVYKRANIDRKLFSKIRNDHEYKPSKVTVVAFAIAFDQTLLGQ